MTDETSRELIAGRYEVVRQIGHGGGGAVWLAQDSLLGRHVAIKQIGAFPGESEGDTRRAMREARLAAALNHPNVVAVYDVIEYDEVPWLVMEYVAGPTLASAIRERGPMSERGVADLGAQLAAALSTAHREGIVHGDVKPSNVLIGGGRPKISDFGLARGNVEQQFTQVGVVMGTPSFTSPEVAVGGKQTGAADVWALGATLYYAIEGQEAFPRLDPPLATLQYIATNPPRTPQRAGALEPVLADMLSRDPSRRGTMDDIARRLEHMAAGGRLRGAAEPVADPTGPGPAPVAAAARPPEPEPDAAEVADREDEPPEMHMVTEPPRSDGGQTVVWVVAIILALLLAALAVALFGVGDDEGSAEGSGTSVVSEESGDQEPTETVDGVGFVQLAGNFVTDFYEQAPEDQEAAWNMLSQEMQEEAGGQSEFEDHWQGMKKAETSDLAVDPKDGTVTLKVRFHPEDGKPSTESVTHTVERVDGVLKITK